MLTSTQESWLCQMFSTARELKARYVRRLIDRKTYATLMLAIYSSDEGKAMLSRLIAA